MCRHLPSRVAALALFCALTFSADASVVYNEAVFGDLSNNGLAPTFIGVASGSNQIFGLTGRGATAIDRDYLTFTVPVGLQLSALTVLPGTSVGSAVSFIGIQSGSQVTVSTAATVANGLLGWTHYSATDIGNDILGRMAIAANGSTGFTTPLGAGNYAVWIQEFGAGSFAYGFDLALAPAGVPEPGTPALVLTGLAALYAVRRRRGSPPSETCSSVGSTPY